MSTRNNFDSTLNNQFIERKRFEWIVYFALYNSVSINTLLYPSEPQTTNVLCADAYCILSRELLCSTHFFFINVLTKFNGQKKSRTLELYTYLCPDVASGHCTTSIYGKPDVICIVFFQSCLDNLFGFGINILDT
jgi:hypothetical protein